jgi:hypothetical protein
MPTPAELREASRLTRLAAAEESDLHLKRRLVSHALALVQVAEQMERERRGTGDIGVANGVSGIGHT